MDKKRLKLVLSRLKVFDKPKLKLEQYFTPSEIAADMLWNAFMLGDIEKKVVLDAGCGTGILGLGALLLGAKKVYFVDVDSGALEILKKNLTYLSSDFDLGKSEILESDILDFGAKDVDLVIQNPPFGTKEKHADKNFLELAFSLKKPVYTFHKVSTSDFVESIASDFGYGASHYWPFSYPLPKTQKFHKKSVEKIEVGCWRLVLA